LYAQAARNTIAKIVANLLQRRLHYGESQTPMIVVPRVLRAVVTAVLLLCLATPLAQAAAPADAPASFDQRSVYIYTPPSATRGDRPAQIVFALHGMGGEGKGFCQGFLNAAERNGWVIVAPTFSYRNWKDPATVAEDDVALTAALAQLLDSMPHRLGRPTSRRAILFGFSRGAQLAHRFALAYPERTSAVAAMAAGTYTLPRVAGEAGDEPLNFPYGTADLGRRLGQTIDTGALARVPFWVAVGRDDDSADDVPRQWDRLLGKTRLQRADAFTRALNASGARATLGIYPALGHVMSAEMIRGATAFMEKAVMAERAANPAAAPSGERQMVGHIPY
jgi:predicted esterase